jgi:hypothetical protein
MRIAAAICGGCLLVLVLVDAFNTLVLLRRTEHVFRIARLYYRATWTPFAAVSRLIRSSRGREGFLGIYGPLSLILLLALWVAGLVIAFALLQWASAMQPATLQGTFWDDLYLSATTLFTLATGDPKNPTSKLITMLEGGLGLGFLGLVIGYLPVLYQSFSTRELEISLLDARAGSPPSAAALVQSAPFDAGKLEHRLEEWESWAGQLLENHLSYPMLAYFRSQHANQSWLTALVAVVDFSALVSLCTLGDLQRQAKLTLVMGRHALTDLALLFGLEGQIAATAQEDRLSADAFEKLQRQLAQHPAFDAKRCSQANLSDVRRLYEPQAIALAGYLLMSIPSWVGDDASRGNWSVGIEGRDDVPFAVSDPFAEAAREKRGKHS